MSPPVDRLDAAAPLPARADVVIIGGGVIGVSTALTLAERGLSVALVEKGHVAGEQSSRNWGWVRTAGRDPAEIPLVMASQRIWAEMNRATGAETGFARPGILYLCESEREVAGYEAWLEEARRFQVGSFMIDADALEKLLPGASKTYVGAMHTPDDCRAEPAHAVPAMARAAMARGATIHEHCAARVIERSGGRVSGVVTEKGVIACDAVVVAAGVWSRLFLGNLGVDFPQLGIVGSVLRTRPLPGGPEPTVGTSTFSWRKRLDGGYTISRRNASIAEITPDSFRLFADFLPQLATMRREIELRFTGRFFEELRRKRRWGADETTIFEQVRTLDPAPNTEILEEGLEHLMRAFPFFRGLEVAQRWAGMIDATPDGIPVISPVAQIPGLYLSSGYSGHGFGIGPGAGRLTADLVSGHAPLVDPAPFRLERFPRARRAA
ncbi:MAG: FAD-binding oxidoreductase [Methylobacteriaceae bacterium]|nr:FAD-binding oxidoreductase [Methylobacteriaceae bacterium]